MRTDGQAFVVDFPASAASRIGFAIGMVPVLPLGGAEQAVGICNEYLRSAFHAD